MSNKLLKILPFILIIVLVVLYLISGNEITPDTIAELLSDKYYITIPVILLMFALKSISIVFPLMVLYLAVGMVFPPVTAILVNLAGIVVMVTVPYCIGHFSGSALTDRLKQKYPKFEVILKRHHSDYFFISYILRAVSFLPGDAVSMYLGSLRIPYKKYFPASVLGMLPGLILVTLIGGSITDPLSPMFFISLSIQILVIAVSLIIYSRFKKNGDE